MRSKDPNRSASPWRARRRSIVAASLLSAAFLVLQAGPVFAQTTSLPHSVGPRSYRVGDDLAWAGPAVSDDSWSPQRPREPGNWWIRASVTLGRSVRSTDDVSLRVFAPGAVEIYWDGRLIGGDGVIGHDSSSEVPGRHGVWAALHPSVATAGEHLVAVRVSTHRIGRIRGPVGVLLLDRANTERKEGARTGFFLFCAGLLILSGIVFGLLHRSLGARTDALLLAAMTVVVGLLMLLEYAKYVYPYPYPWHFPRLLAISLLTLSVGLLLPLFVLARLRLGGRWVLTAALSILYLVIAAVQTDPDFHSLSILRVAIIVSFSLAGIGATLGRNGSRAILLACAANLLPLFFTGFRYADHWFFVGFLAMVAVLLVGMARTLRRRAQEREAALSRVDRLRYELVRRTIQPHFLMNSLAVAIGYIEEDPPRGIAFVRDLSRELEAFLRLTARDSVSLTEELDLCRMHVATMEHLLDRPIGFAVKTDETPIDTPPGVILTLVENAITHGRVGDPEPIRVTIRGEREDVIIDVTNPIDPPGGGADAEGAGLRFVRAQLVRDRAAVWDFDTGPSGAAWHARLRRSTRPADQGRRSRSAP